MTADPRTQAQKRLSTVFGWVAGGALGLIVDYVAYTISGPSYPLVPATFGLFVVGCFGGMWLADRLGGRAFRVLGIAAGALLGIALVLFGATWL